MLILPCPTYLDTFCSSATPQLLVYPVLLRIEKAKAVARAKKADAVAGVSMRSVEQEADELAKKFSDTAIRWTHYTSMFFVCIYLISLENYWPDTCAPIHTSFPTSPSPPPPSPPPTCAPSTSCLMHRTTLSHGHQQTT